MYAGQVVVGLFCASPVQCLLIALRVSDNQGAGGHKLGGERVTMKDILNSGEKGGCCRVS